MKTPPCVLFPAFIISHQSWIANYARNGRLCHFVAVESASTEEGFAVRTIGILYPGDMGHNVARVLLEDGFFVVTTLAGRSARTRRLAESTTVTILDSLPQVAERADIILSIVPPAAAKTV